MTAVIRCLRLLLLGLWLGTAIFFAASVAPALFSVLRGAELANASELAGTVVTRLLSIINKGGFEIGLFLFITAFFVNRNRSSLARVTEMISTAILVIMTAVSHWIISARMLALRAAMESPIDQVSPADPLRMAFDALHQWSVILMSIALIAGLVAFVVMAWLTKNSDSAFAAHKNLNSD